MSESEKMASLTVLWHCRELMAHCHHMFTEMLHLSESTNSYHPNG